LFQQFFNPRLLYSEPQTGQDMMMLGLVGTSLSGTDRFISRQVTTHLFAENPPHGLGQDLASLTIQRGRDHGVPGQSRHHTIQKYILTCAR